ncbi:tRNA (guanosine(37)-N1)-methyltransferase TrmD [Candidatus Peregrinibacteria bacterium]|nr:tRNA (guanosine(37)-N1)-methyltransferase TrmD [Candidatus Peregrinibacteria bacterium]
MRFDLLTIFPDIFKSYFNESIIKNALNNDKIIIKVHDIRKFSKDKHKKVDDVPYGGGPGMIMTPQPIYDCIQYVKKNNNGPVIYMSPAGDILSQNKAQRLYKTLNGAGGAIILCGRYEGIDQRIIDLCVDKQISIGKYVLTGGELPAMVLIDVLSRFIPGVLGTHDSIAEESFSKALKGKKEYPHYTRPVMFKSKKVPDVLQSGHHAKIKKWREDNLR